MASEDATAPGMHPVGPTAPVDPADPKTPAIPVFPAAPVAPTAPVGPAAPVTRVAPTAPTAPVAPATLVAPMDPTAPAAPAAPVGPAAPMAPAAPVTPMVPAAPVGPTAPVGPATPVAPAAPAVRKKSQKKEKPQAGEDAQKRGDEAAGVVAKIEALTHAGHRALELGKGEEAVGCFRKAFRLSGGTGSPRLRRVCAFNLGAAYLEAGKPKKALGFLLQSQPSDGESEKHSGDFSFNIGAAHKGLRDFSKALECFGKAGAPRGVAGAGSRAGTCVRMGCCYLGLRAPARAARCFLDAAGIYAAAASPEAAAVALSKASGSMLQSRGFQVAEIAGVLAQCRSLCESLPDPALQGKLYNEIGLGYSQLHIFSLAAESFERALALCSRTGPDRTREAAVLQNLGAAHNALHSFSTALGWHRRALALHSALGNRRAQGQCFGNLAHACSQLRDHEAAAENYLHALQAFRDSGDIQGQWQACEGLGAAHFHLGAPQKAIRYYKEALTLLSHCQDTPRAAHEQVVQKLTEAIQHQLCLQGHLSQRGGWDPTPDPSQLEFCSRLPHTSRTGLRQCKVSFREKNQAGAELYKTVPRAPPGCSDKAVALPGSPTPETRDPRGHLDTSGEDEDGPRHHNPNSDPNTTRCPPSALPCHPSTHPRGCAHQKLQHNNPERSGDTTAATTGCQEPRTGRRILSLICSLV